MEPSDAIRSHYVAWGSSMTSKGTQSLWTESLKKQTCCKMTLLCSVVPFEWWGLKQDCLLFDLCQTSLVPGSIFHSLKLVMEWYSGPGMNVAARGLASFRRPWLASLFYGEFCLRNLWMAPQSEGGNRSRTLRHALGSPRKTRNERSFSSEINWLRLWMNMLRTQNRYNLINRNIQPWICHESHPTRFNTHGNHYLDGCGWCTDDQTTK